MRFGAAREIITPYFNMDMEGFAGYFGKGLKSIHDDIFAHALILEDDGYKKALIVTVDVLFHEYSLNREIMRFAGEKCSIPSGNVLVNYSHTHYGPALRNYGQWTNSDEYESYLDEAIKRCILRAELNLTDGEVSYAVAEGDWNISRRLTEDGVCLFRPNIYGGRDKKLKILKFSDKTGTARALLLNYACHPSSTASDLAISGEYPGRLCQLADAMLYGCTSLFMQGFAGDTKSRYAVADGGKSFRSIPFSELDHMAANMFEAVKHAFLINSFTSLKLDLSGKNFVTPLKLKAYPKSYFEEQAATIYPGYIAKCLQYIIENYDTLSETLELQSSILRLTENMFIFALGGEPSSDMETVLKDAFPDKDLIFSGYSDDIAYIPTDEMIREGGYEAEGSVIEYRLKGSIAEGVNEAVARCFRENLAVVSGVADEQR
jgi:neutral ceramidase